MQKNKFHPGLMPFIHLHQCEYDFSRPGVCIIMLGLVSSPNFFTGKFGNFHASAGLWPFSNFLKQNQIALACKPPRIHQWIVVHVVSAESSPIFASLASSKRSDFKSL